MDGWDREEGYGAEEGSRGEQVVMENGREEQGAKENSREEYCAGEKPRGEQGAKEHSPEEQSAEEGSRGEQGAKENGREEHGTEKDSRERENIQGDWEAIVEAVLFTMGQPVELRQLAAAIGQDQETARKVVESLTYRYDTENRGMQVIRLEDSYQLCTRGRFYENLIRVAATPKRQTLTETVLETLSIIAYKQPVTRMEIEKIRGVNSDHAVNRLVEYGLAEEIGRLDAPGRPALFATTEEFLRRFGIGSRDDLPDMDPVRKAEIRSEVEEELNVELGEDPEATGAGEAGQGNGPEEAEE